MYHIKWIGGLEDLGYSSDEDRKALKEALSYVLKSVKKGVTSKYIRQEFVRQLSEKLKLNFIEKITIKRMIKAQLENHKELTEVQLNGVISSLELPREED